MIKTIKVKKKFRLDELIRKVWDGEIAAKIYKSDKGLKEVSIYPDRVSFTYTENDSVVKEDTFTVEVEEEVTKRTLFDWLVEVNKSGIHEEETSSISAIEDEDTIRIYALIENKLELIWEAK